MTTPEQAVERLTRPIVGIENRTPQEVFDIMADRFRGFAQARQPASEGECTHEAFETDSAAQPTRCCDCSATLSIAAPQPSKVDGFVSVPVEPTEEMWKAGSVAHEAHERPFTQDAIRAGYRAMLSAAPKAAQDGPEPAPGPPLDYADWDQFDHHGARCRPDRSAPKAPVEGEAKADIAADREWISGARFGWNCAEAGDRQKLDDALEGRRREIKAAQEGAE